MKIAILADPIDNQKAGIHVYTKELIKQFDQTNTKHDIFILREKVGPEFQHVHQIALGPIKSLWSRFVRVFFQIPQICTKLEIDAVIELAHMGPFNLPKKIKRVTVIHDLTPLTHPEWHNNVSQIIQRLLLPRILKKADLILANSKNTLNDIIKYFPDTSRKSFYLYPGLNSSIERTRSRELLNGLGISKNYFHFIGTIEPRKNLLSLLDAFHIYKENNGSNCQLVIAGQKGWKSKKFYKQLEKHKFKKDIIITGFITDEILCQLNSHSVALVYPSLYEGFGFPVLEALSCGTKVITSNNSSLIEFKLSRIYHVDPLDSLEIAEMMQKARNEIMEESDKIKSIKETTSYNWSSFYTDLIKAIESL